MLFRGALGLLSIPSALVLLAGILLKENRGTEFDYMQVRTNISVFESFNSSKVHLNSGSQEVL